MKDFVLDVWADLRERRLWPVAALLLLGLVAVPVVLVKPVEEAPSQAAGPVAPNPPGNIPGGQALIKVTEDKPLVRISRLDKFSSRDPFKPIEKLKPLGGGDLTASGGGAGGTVSGPAGGGGGAVGGQGGPPPGGPPGLSNPGGGAPEGGSPGGTETKPEQKYTYAVDLTFVDGKATKHHKGFDRLGMLPSESSPLLVFLGVDTSGTRAAFLVDSSLQAAGEGSCKPSPSSCGVVYLEPGQEESFKQADGHSYTLRIDQIRQEPVRASSARASITKQDDGRPARRFVFPVLIDLEIGGHR